MPELQSHPTNNELAAFGLGKLEPDDAEPISAHVAECEPCSETLAGLCNDTFLDLIQRADDVVMPATDALHAPTLTDSGDVQPPRQLAEHSRYRTVELLGRGGMGVVYKAEHRLMNRTVALKAISNKLVANPAAVERFRREVQAAARLSHPNIVTSHDAEQAGELHFLVMEYVDGTDLSKVVKEQGPPSVQDACDWIRQAAQGLQHAHELGMIHRDIKPHNLMVTTDGVVKILDFGLATVASLSDESLPRNPENGRTDVAPRPGRGLTRTGMAMGTPDFVSPEQVTAPQCADARSDVYSLGCTLYYLLTGHPPFEGESVTEKLSAHQQREPRPLAELRTDIPRELCEVVERMMAKDPNSRLQSASAVAEALQPWACAGASPTKAQTKRNRSPRWVRPLLAVAGSVLLLAAVIVIVLEWNKGTLTIESDADVAIRVLKGDHEYQRMKVTAGSTSVRIAAGNYVVEIDEEIDGLRVEDGKVSLWRGEQQVVKIVRSQTGRDDLNASAGPITSGVVDNRIIYRPPGDRDDEADALRAGNLAAHVAKFNRYCRDHPVGKDQPPLTEDEVLSSIRWKIATDESFDKDPNYEKLKRMVDSHFLPDGWTIIGSPTRDVRRSGKRLFFDWQISLSIAAYGLFAPPPAHVVRHRSIQPVNPPKRVEHHQESNGMPLAAAIRAFNGSQLMIDGKRQPSLTEDEVLAAIERWSYRRDEAPVVNRDFAAFQRIAQTRTLPKETEFDVLRGFRPGDGKVYFIYSVLIRMPKSNQEGGTFAYTIREQFIRSRSETDDDGAFLDGIEHFGLPEIDLPAKPEQLLGTWGIEGTEDHEKRSTITIARQKASGFRFRFTHVNGTVQEGLLSAPSRSGRFTLVVTDAERGCVEWYGGYDANGDTLTLSVDWVNRSGWRGERPTTDWSQMLECITPRLQKGIFRRVAGANDD